MATKQPARREESALVALMHERYTFIEKQAKQVVPPVLSESQMLDLNRTVRMQADRHKSDPFFAKRLYTHFVKGIEDYRDYMGTSKTV